MKIRKIKDDNRFELSNLTAGDVFEHDLNLFIVTDNDMSVVEGRSDAILTNKSRIVVRLDNGGIYTLSNRVIVHKINLEGVIHE